MGRGNHESIKEFNLFLSFFSSQRLLESGDAHSTQDAIPEGASFLVSGLRSEYSNLPRSTLAGSSVNHAERHTRNTVAHLRCSQRPSSEGRDRGAVTLGHAAETGQTLLLSANAFTRNSIAYLCVV